jgi:type 1 fimbria pilin
VELDGINYEYGKPGNDLDIGAGTAQLMPGSGMYIFTGSAQLTSAGNWWVRAKIAKGDVQADANFTISVKPAQ